MNDYLNDKLDEINTTFRDVVSLVKMVDGIGDDEMMTKMPVPYGYKSVMDKNGKEFYIPKDMVVRDCDTFINKEGEIFKIFASERFDEVYTEQTPTFNEVYKPPSKYDSIDTILGRKQPLNPKSDIDHLINEIKRFTPSSKYRNEYPYHTELTGWLKHDFDVIFDKRKGASQPDLVVNGVAIEVKGPTRTRDLQTIPSKLLRYGNHWDTIILVFFEREYSQKYYYEWVSGLREKYPDVIIIEK
jgi:hypothetical protein